MFCSVNNKTDSEFAWTSNRNEACAESKNVLLGKFLISFCVSYILGAYTCYEKRRVWHVSIIEKW